MPLHDHGAKLSAVRRAESGNQSQRLQVTTGGVSEEERRSMGDRERTDASDPLAAEVRCAEHDARPDMCPESDYEVRRLMPIECARLMGFPPDWCDDVPHTDSAEYKLWGNGIALPTIIPMMKAMGAVIEDEISREICEPRICTACGKEMWQGYVIHDGDEYYCSDECLHEYYSEDEYDQLCQEDEGYWTQWD